MNVNVNDVTFLDCAWSLSLSLLMITQHEFYLAKCLKLALSQTVLMLDARTLLMRMESQLTTLHSLMQNLTVNDTTLLLSCVLNLHKRHVSVIVT